jgi:hypothetical protein
LQLSVVLFMATGKEECEWVCPWDGGGLLGQHDAAWLVDGRSRDRTGCTDTVSPVPGRMGKEQPQVNHHSNASCQVEKCLALVLVPRAEESPSRGPIIVCLCSDKYCSSHSS